MILGIVSIPLCFLTIFDLPVVILGLTFSIMGLAAAKKGAGRRGMALAGLICSIVGAVAIFGVFAFALNRASTCGQQYSKGTQAYSDCIRTGH
jgi:hypothetical protein